MKIIQRYRRAILAPVSIVILLCGCTDLVSSRSPRFAEHPKNDSDFVSVDCERVKPFFESKNITILVDRKQATAEDIAKTTCNGMCCDRDTEEQLRHQARADFHDLIHHHSRSLQGLLATTADALRETVTMLARQSENKTLTLFDQVYRTMAVSSRPSIKALYQAMVDYVSPSNTPDSLQQPLTRDMLQERFIEFFAKLFPIAYHGAVNPRQYEQDFTEKFKTCLYETMEQIQPFGDIPVQVAKSVSKSLEATRVLVQALTLGKTVLDRTDSVLFSGTSPQQEACYAALLRMTYCPRCKGIGPSVRPCSGFCTNVMRGCLTQPASELDLAWSGYVETVERLVVAVDGRNDPLGLNAERAVRQLDTRISDAIMHAMTDGPALEEKVRKVCGRSELEPSPSSERSVADAAGGTGKSSSSSSSSGGIEMHAAAAAPPSRTLPSQLHVQLGNFLASVVRSRTFYGTLADTICEEYPDKRCWNGERVGEYTKTVADSSLTAQRYNPEFTVTTMSPTTASYGNANTSVLIDQLRHINQILQSQLASAPDSGTLLGDEALDGSGSGDRPIWNKKNKDEDIDNDDEDVHGYDHDDEEASGSGMGPTTPDPMLKTNHENPVTAGAGSSIILLSSIVSMAIGCCAPLLIA
ncbi:division abnormally delayed protein isoform X1 [Apis mellifera caucasica]|uniref:Division abnormally delayed protein isoform X1 n=1 Tax=Apis mellifera TaxID=7460 RepID=A0A7M7L2D6_APIME|nr:division abnormally delayed protein isoform X1 [Apis mellifera]KAG6800619.1 division abnormally delayed protein isoform X1 [Apis mellifera caucasica]|eukprot:XP_026296717.1 division abnormally delayed protein isoform X1 [Apis mellifera]